MIILDLTCVGQSSHSDHVSSVTEVISAPGFVQDVEQTSVLASDFIMTL